MLTIDNVRALATTLPRTTEALIESDPETFMMPIRGDLRYRWVEARLSRLDAEEMRELVLDAWRMCVSKRVPSTTRSTQEHRR